MPNKKTRGISNLPVAIPDVPDAPTVTAVNVGTSRAYNNGSATVTITSPTGGRPSSYSIATTPITSTTTATSSPATITGLSSATSYTTTVTPTNVSATGAATTSSAFTATTIPNNPAAPTATDAGSGRAYNSGSASVAFTAPATGGTAISSYTVTSSPGSFTGTGSSSPITVTGQQSATAYTYTITATNANGTSTASSASGSVTATTVPQAPTIGTFTDGGTGTTGTLSFTAGATGGSAITNYKISTDNVTYTALSPTQTTSPLSLSGLSVGTATYYIKAVNANGDSAASSGVSGTVITPTSYESISTMTLSSSAASVTLSSIPATYKSLQIRWMAKDTRTDLDSATNMIIVTPSSAAWHWLYGNGTAASAGNMGGSTGSIQIYQAYPCSYTGTTSMFGAGILDIIDYASTTKYKTFRSFSGTNVNTATAAYGPTLASGLSLSTAAISSLVFTANTTFEIGTTFALYGIK